MNAADLQSAQAASAARVLRALAGPPSSAALRLAIARFHRRSKASAPVVHLLRSPLEAPRLAALVAAAEIVAKHRTVDSLRAEFVIHDTRMALFSTLRSSVADPTVNVQATALRAALSHPDYATIARPSLSLGPDTIGILSCVREHFRRTQPFSRRLAAIALRMADLARPSPISHLIDEEALRKIYARIMVIPVTRQMCLQWTGAWMWGHFDRLLPLGAAARAGMLDPANGALVEDIIQMATGAFTLRTCGDSLVAVAAPTQTQFDVAGRLHSEEGPALRFRDGFAVYALEGVVVPPPIALGSESPMLDDIMYEDDPARRRLYMHRFGGLRGAEACDAWLSRMNALRIDADARHGELFRVEVTRRRRAYLRVQCPSTRQIHHLEVPPSVRSARAARAWTFDVSPRVLDRAFET